MKVLTFNCRGEAYRVSLENDTMGHIIQAGHKTFSLPHPTWKIIGFASHHWCNAPDCRIEHVEKVLGKYPTALNQNLVFDNDHGTVRKWGGQYNGKLPRVTFACVAS